MTWFLYNKNINTLNMDLKLKHDSLHCFIYYLNIDISYKLR